MTAHAKFSPSGAHRWMQCPASLVMERDAPDESSIYADEGTAAHTLASECLLSGDDAAKHLERVIEVTSRDGKKVNKFIVDEDFAEAVQMYLDDVRRRSFGQILLVEQRLEFSDAIQVPDQFGTGDAIIIAGRRLIVEDLKFGMGERVFVENNEQLLTYAVGAVEQYEAIAEFDEVTMVVHQPRLNHVDEWTVPISRIREHAKLLPIAAHRVKVAFEYFEAGGLDAIESYFAPGAHTCRWCKAKATCPALARYTSEMVFRDFEAIENETALAMGAPPPPTENAFLAAKLSALPVIEDWCRAIRAEGDRRVFAGETLYGADGLPYKVVEGKKGARAWTDKEIAEGLLTGHLPPEKAYKPREIITPTAAEKHFKKKPEVWETFKGIIKQAPGGLSVVPGSDPRPPYSGAATANEFADETAAEEV